MLEGWWDSLLIGREAGVYGFWWFLLELCGGRWGVLFELLGTFFFLAVDAMYVMTLLRES